MNGRNIIHLSAMAKFLDLILVISSVLNFLFMHQDFHVTKRTLTKIKI